MILISQTQDEGYTVFNFEANNTQYQILKDDSEFYQVYSKRKSLSNWSAPKLYTLQEMSERSKALKNLAALISS